jgi:hypothetical protein
MAKGKLGGFELQHLVIVVGVAIAGIFLWGQLFPDNTWVSPSQTQTESIALWVIKLGALMFLAYLGVGAANKFISGRVARPTLITYLILGLAIYFCWDFVFARIFNADSLDTLVKMSAQKLGLLG